jgi:hypothetical protein
MQCLLTYLGAVALRLAKYVAPRGFVVQHSVDKCRYPASGVPRFKPTLDNGPVKASLMGKAGYHAIRGGMYGSRNNENGEYSRRRCRVTRSLN